MRGVEETYRDSSANVAEAVAETGTPVRLVYVCTSRCGSVHEALQLLRLCRRQTSSSAESAGGCSVLQHQVSAACIPVDGGTISCLGWLYGVHSLVCMIAELAWTRVL